MNHREMKALAENDVAVRALASYLLRLPEIDSQVTWTDWEIDFLGNMSRHVGPEPLSVRQVEMLAELRDAAQSTASLDGFGIASLVDACWLGKLDLDESNEAFIDDLKAKGARTLKRRQALRLLACARQLGVVERYVDLVS